MSAYWICRVHFSQNSLCIQDIMWILFFPLFSIYIFCSHLFALCEFCRILDGCLLFDLQIFAPQTYLHCSLLTIVRHQMCYVNFTDFAMIFFFFCVHKFNSSEWITCTINGSVNWPVNIKMYWYQIVANTLEKLRLCEKRNLGQLGRPIWHNQLLNCSSVCENCFRGSGPYNSIIWSTAHFL